MKKYLILLLSCVIQVNTLFASPKVYILKSCASFGLRAEEELCIVADSNDWTCAVNGTHTLITGQSRTFPMTFDFQIGLMTHAHYGYNEKNIMRDAEIYLHDYAKRTNTVFSSVCIRDAGNEKYVINGAYFDNNCFGEFALHMQQVGTDKTGRLRDLYYVMFVRLKESVSPYPLDDGTRESLYQNALDLITPIYSTK